MKLPNEFVAFVAGSRVLRFTKDGRDSYSKHVWNKEWVFDDNVDERTARHYYESSNEWVNQLKKALGVKPADKFKVGEKCLWVVGMPGPDVDDCEIIADIGDGTYRIRYQVYGQGEFFEENAYAQKLGEVTTIGTLIKTVKD